MNSILVIILMLVLCFVLAAVVSTMMTKKAMYQIIRSLKKNGALNAKNSKSMAELGFSPKSFVEQIMKFRDYKPKTLEFLIKLNIVMCKEDGSIFLSEKELLSSKLLEKWPSLERAIRDN